MMPGDNLCVCYEREEKRMVKTKKKIMFGHGGLLPPLLLIIVLDLYFVKLEMEVFW